MDIYSILFYFYIYAFVGWCTEVAFAGFKEKRFVNRGFLNGPLCPIYGVGVTAVVMMAKPFEHNLVVLYIVSAVVVTAIELVTGFVMDKLFHHKWWDYSGKPFNIGGYVCLPFSLIWGVACVFIVKVIHPLLIKLVNLIPYTLGLVLLILFTLSLLADVVVTYIEVLKLNKQLDALEKVAEELHQFSNRIGYNIFEKVTDTLELQEKIANITDEQKENAQKLLNTYKENMKTGHIRNRLVKAFPTMKPGIHKEAFESLKRRLRKD